MAVSTYNKTVVFNGTKKLALLYTPLTIDEQTPITIDASAYNATSFTINEINYNCAGMGFTISEDAGTDVVVFAVSAVGGAVSGKLCFKEYGGIPNSKATDYTGDLIITPVSMAAGDVFFLYIELTKNY